MKTQGNLLPRLSARLSQLADWVPQDARFADIGTDHGYLPVWLSLKGRISSAIACDLRQRPLERARETSRRYYVNPSDILFRLGDGLSIIRPEEVDVIAIAGMGGEHIAKILESAPWTADGRHILLLQPMTHAEVLRQFLSEHGYKISQERLVLEREILYPCLEVQAGEERLTPGQIWGGAKLSQDALGDRYLIEKIVRLQIALIGARSSEKNSEKNLEKIESLREILTALLTMREEWRHCQ